MKVSVHILPHNAAETATALRAYARLLRNWLAMRCKRQPWAVGEANLKPTLASQFERARRGLELHSEPHLADRFKECHEELLALVTEADQYPLDSSTPRAIDDAAWMRRVELDLEICTAAGLGVQQVEFAILLADKLEGKQAHEGKVARKRGRRRGRPRSSDPSEDQRLYEAWKTGHFVTYAEFASAKGLEERGVRLAIDRARKKQEKG